MLNEDIPEDIKKYKWPGFQDKWVYPKVITPRERNLYEKYPISTVSMNVGKEVYLKHLFWLSSLYFI